MKLLVLLLFLPIPSSPFVIPSMVPKERRASKWMIHVDFNLTEKCCTIIPRDKNHLSIQSGFFSVQNCMKCCGRRQEKFMMPSLPLKNLQLPCGNQTHTHIHTHTHLQNNRTLNCLALTRMAIGSSSLVFEATCREALWDSCLLYTSDAADEVY